MRLLRRREKITDWFNREIKPMLAVKGEPFNSHEYIFEPKWDGTRCIVFVDVERKRIRLQNRRLLDITKRYPELEFTEFLSENAIIDGEIIVLEGGKPSFRLLQKREQVDSTLKIEILSKMIPAVYFAFDILYTESEGWVMDKPLLERKKILNGIGNETQHVIISEFIKEKGKQFYRLSVDAGLEGVIGKRIDSKYMPGRRSDAWVKMKKRKTADCIIVGWLEGEGRRENMFASLILALYDNGDLIHVGRVGTGFSTEFLEEFMEKLKEIEVSEQIIPDLRFSRKAHWVKPQYVCEIEFLEVTSDMKFRAPVFLRLRDDKSIEECTLNQLK